ncbi:MAG: 16S rRNA (adenine(1518)-N(6)/adenine(1519)-N(6))-dimethyltransferase RsmA [Candidatus Glassbacteria bacterium]
METTRRSASAGRSRRQRKRLGQHFLKDRSVVRRIIEALEPLQEAHVLEIGAGRGALTGELTGRAGRLTALELDSSLAGRLELEFTSSPRVTVLRSDASAFDYSAWAQAAKPERPVIVGNIPYSITNALLHALIAHGGSLGTVVLMLQEEVARRITAQAGGKPYGMLTVLANYHAAVDYLFAVKRDSFAPPPAVDSAVVRFDFGRPHRPRARDERSFEFLVRRLFDQRRKQVQKILRLTSQFALGPDSLASLAVATGIDLSSRPERLTVDQFVRLSDALAESES